MYKKYNLLPLLPFSSRSSRPPPAPPLPPLSFPLLLFLSSLFSSHHGVLGCGGKNAYCSARGGGVLLKKPAARRHPVGRLAKAAIQAPPRVAPGSKRRAVWRLARSLQRGLGWASVVGPCATRCGATEPDSQPCGVWIIFPQYSENTLFSCNFQKRN